jgi:hypothetical protein
VPWFPTTFSCEKKRQLCCFDHFYIFLSNSFNLHLLAKKMVFHHPCFGGNLHLLVLSYGGFLCHGIHEASWSPELAQAAGIHGTSIQRLAKTFRELLLDELKKIEDDGENADFWWLIDGIDMY